ncbi:hypothetical protein DPV78_005675 [Talaromyces pinophilus]|nr:hypothetical protein DPV78_005675 [Talaromyces pinophilus]
MAKQLKLQVKENRRGDRISISGHSAFDAELTTSSFQNSFKELPIPIDQLSMTTADIHVAGVKPCPELSNIWLQRGTDPQPPCEHNPQSVVFGRSDTVLIMFCLLPFWLRTHHLRHALIRCLRGPVISSIADCHSRADD